MFYGRRFNTQVLASPGAKMVVPGSGAVRFATLCVYFAPFAVSLLFYRKGRQERAKERKERHAQSSALHRHTLLTELRIDAGLVL
jgi:hypothetical protein